MPRENITVSICLTPQELQHISRIQRQVANQAGHLSRSGTVRWLINLAADAIRKDGSIALIPAGRDAVEAAGMEGM